MKKQTFKRVIAIALAAGMMMGTMPVNASTNLFETVQHESSAALRQEASTNDLTYKLDVTGETGTVHLDGSDADKVINIEQGSRLFITLPSNVGANVGSSDVGTVNPIKATASGYDLNIIPWGTVGSKTGMFFNGKKLFTIQTAQHSGTWTMDAVPVAHFKTSNAKYAFSVTTPSGASLEINTGNGKIATIDRLKQGNAYMNNVQNSDGTVTHYFSARSLWGSCSFGVYIHVDGKQYLIFRGVIDGTQSQTHIYTNQNQSSSSDYYDQYFHKFHDATYGCDGRDQYNYVIDYVKTHLDKHMSEINAQIASLTEDEQSCPGALKERFGLDYSEDAVKLVALDNVGILDDLNYLMGIRGTGDAYTALRTKQIRGCSDEAKLSQVIDNMAGYDCKLSIGTYNGQDHLYVRVFVNNKWYYDTGRHFSTDVESPDYADAGEYNT